MKSDRPNRKVLFDRWSAHYDLSVDEGGFPFIGYKMLLFTIAEMCELHADQRILDLGVGTGNLVKTLPVRHEQIWGADFSSRMLVKAADVLDPSHLIQVDLLAEDWPPKMNGLFDRIVSGYTLHEFTESQKCSLLLRLAEECLTEDGWIVVGDISFSTRRAFDEAHQAYQGLWDEEEYYWCAEEMMPSLEALGFAVQYQQVSSCAGVYRFSSVKK